MIESAVRIEGETESAPNALMPRHTVAAIVALRDEALREFEKAYSALLHASTAQKTAHAAWSKAASNTEDRYTASSRSEKQKFIASIEMIDRKDYLATARRLVDVDVWAHVIKLTDLERLMDKEAKEQFHRELMDNPPEATVDNICATLQQFAASAGDVFRRGVANAFSKLDRRFKSHDGFKVGHRMILDRMFDENGWFNYHRDMESTLLDVERALLVLDERRVMESYAGIVGTLRATRGRGHGARQSEIENEYFTIRCFKNGNAHCWFKRADLVERVNKLLAEWYGEAVGDGMTAEENPLKNPKLTPAKRYGFFPTPEGAIDRVIDKVPLRRRSDEPRLRVLEPSAGTGNLARRCIVRPHKAEGRSDYSVNRAKEINEGMRFDNVVDCVEVQPDLADALRREGVYGRVTCADFLATTPDPASLYDRVVMNPPFDRERDVDHVVHAMKFLKPDGFLIAIMSAGTEWRETKKSEAFRALTTKLRARWEELPAGSFASVGTNVNTVMVQFWNDGRTFW